MKRGDVVTVAAAGDYGKPLPAVIIQTNALPTSHASVIVCQMTTNLVEAPDFRITVEPTPRNGLRGTLPGDGGQTCDNPPRAARRTDRFP